MKPPELKGEEVWLLAGLVEKLEDYLSSFATPETVGLLGGALKDLEGVRDLRRRLRDGLNVPRLHPMVQNLAIFRPGSVRK